MFSAAEFLFFLFWAVIVYASTDPVQHWLSLVHAGIIIAVMFLIDRQ